MAYPPEDYNICPSCGTEFGYDDAALSHEELRAEWLEEGASWWSPAQPPPPGWDGITQLIGFLSQSPVWTNPFQFYGAIRKYVNAHGDQDLKPILRIARDELIRPLSKQRVKRHRRRYGIIEKINVTHYIDVPLMRAS